MSGRIVRVSFTFAVPTFHRDPVAAHVPNSGPHVPQHPYLLGPTLRPVCILFSTTNRLPFLRMLVSTAAPSFTTPECLHPASLNKLYAPFIHTDNFRHIYCVQSHLRGRARSPRAQRPTAVRKHVRRHRSRPRLISRLHRPINKTPSCSNDQRRSHDRGAEVDALSANLRGDLVPLADRCLYPCLPLGR